MTLTSKSSKKTNLNIDRVVIKRLFGQFNYDLISAELHRDIAILYGENGSGKTTVLQLVFHLLSAAPDRSHRTALASVPFESIAVYLSNGAVVSATRNNGVRSFPLSLEIKKPGKKTARWLYVPTSVKGEYYNENVKRNNGMVVRKKNGSLEIVRTNERIKEDEIDRNYLMHMFMDDGESDFLEALESLSLTLYYVSSDRQIRSDELDANSEKITWREFGNLQDKEGAQDAISAARSWYLNQAMQNAARWIYKQAVIGTNTGSDNANNIYAQVIESIASFAGPVSDSIESEVGGVIQELREISARSEKYAKFGFSPSVSTDRMIRNIRSADIRQIQTIKTVIAPFLETSKARLDALSQIHNLVSKFIRYVNDFLAYKTIEFSLGKGFVIKNLNGDDLKPGQLSSGEQQLLLLFCHVLIAREHRSVFMVDEPEISLNIKWQRKLVAALLDISEGSFNQFIFATHSLEILSLHSDKVVEMMPIFSE